MNCKLCPCKKFYQQKSFKFGSIGYYATCLVKGIIDHKPSGKSGASTYYTVYDRPTKMDSTIAGRGKFL